MSGLCSCLCRAVIKLGSTFFKPCSPYPYHKMLVLVEFYQPLTISVITGVAGHIQPLMAALVWS